MTYRFTELMVVLQFYLLWSSNTLWSQIRFRLNCKDGVLRLHICRACLCFASKFVGASKPATDSEVTIEGLPIVGHKCHVICSLLYSTKFLYLNFTAIKIKCLFCDSDNLFVFWSSRRHSVSCYSFSPPRDWHRIFLLSQKTLCITSLIDQT